MKTIGLFCGLLASCICGLAQTAKPSDLLTAGGFLDVCGRKDQVSKQSIETVKKAPPNEAMAAIKKALDDSVADNALCLAYVNGLFEGWKEGHEHGVLAAHFPAGVPRNLDTALKSLSGEDLRSINLAMKTDVPCTPENLTFGELKDVAVRYIRNLVEKYPLLRVALTSRVFPWPLHEASPCPAEQPLGQSSKGAK